MAITEKSNGNLSVEKLIELRDLAERDNDTELINKINQKLTGQSTDIGKLTELRDLAERDNDIELLQKVNTEIQKLSGPSLLPGNQGLPFTEQHRSGRSTLNVPTQQPAVGLMRGEERAPTLLERFVTPDLEKPFDIRDVITYGGATAASLAAPELALPAALSRLGPITPLLRQSPQIVASGAAGSGGRMIEEATEGGDLTDILAAGGRGFQEFAGAEAAGVGLGSGLAAGARAITGKALTQGEKDLVKFAKKNKLFLPISGLREGTGLASKLEKASDLTAFGNYLRQRAAGKIDKTIEQTVSALTPYAQSSEVIAPKIQLVLKEILEGKTNAKNVAYDELKNVIGANTVVDNQLIKRGAQATLDLAKREGETSGAAMSRLKKYLKEDVVNDFKSLEGIRKNTLGALRKSGRTHDIAQPLQDAFDETYQRLSQQYNYNLNDAISRANIRMKALTDLKKVPGIKKYSQDINNSQGYIFGLVNEGNQKALKIIKQKSPDLYQSLIEQRLALTFDSNGTFSPNKFIKFVNDNPSFIKETYGDETSKVLKNFSNYLQTTSDLLKAKSKPNSELAGAIRGAGLSGLTGTIFRSPILTASTEASGIILASLLTRPTSPIYQLFVSLDPIKISKALKNITPFVTRTQAEQFGPENLQQNIEQGQSTFETIFQRPQ